MLSFDDDDDIPDDALEFNADATQVFVEPPPNPEWTAATGTFKAIVLKSEELSGMNPATSPKAPTPTPGPAGGAGSSTQVFSSEFNSSFQEDEIELDADFLSATSEMRRLKINLGDAEPGPGSSPGLTQKPTPPIAPIPHGAATSPPGAVPHIGTTSLPGAARTAPAQPTSQAQLAPSARMAPRGPLTEPPARPIVVEPPAQLRTSSAETPARQQQSTGPAPDDEVFPEPEVVTRAQPRNAVKAFGLDSVEPPPAPPERLATLARSRVAPGSVELEPAAAKRPFVNSPALWGASSGALVILLIGQIINHYRDDLAATTQFNKPITALYGALGVHLTPHWDLHAYDVRQLGASVDAASAGQIMVRASVKNGASQPQPMPLLRVTLQDRFGNRIAARDVAPGNYLPRATAATTFLPAGQRIDAEMAFVDPGANAVGFEIDACLPAPAGGIACANDPVSR
jgi:hypothetical protein